jgi:hypothetical protein
VAAPDTWQRILETSESIDHAQLRVAHAAYRQLRDIKLILAWALFGIPAVALVVWLFVAKTVY